MKLLRVLLATVVLLAATLAFTSTAQAAGKAPHGNPFAYLTEDDHWSNFVCDDPTVTDFLVARAGNPGWVPGDTDRMYVLTSIGGEFTITFPDSSQDTYQFHQSYGERAGRAERVTCTGDFGHTHDGVTEEGVMTIVVARIW